MEIIIISKQQQKKHFLKKKNILFVNVETNLMLHYTNVGHGTVSRKFTYRVKLCLHLDYHSKLCMFLIYASTMSCKCFLPNTQIPQPLEVEGR